MAIEMTQACARDEREKVAISNSNRRYMTYVHAAYSRGYDSSGPTLCGKRFYDPALEANGPEAWASVSCRACLKAIAKKAAK